ncbi:MAG: hypothetical protein K0S29_384 [Gammaproteobacteria bacterium]|jgi:hypothetical protein|nr:hypothetical protein [Gammaproteobacteria bacterium]
MSKTKELNWQRSQMIRLLNELSDSQISNLYLPFINNVRGIYGWKNWFIKSNRELKHKTMA